MLINQETMPEVLSQYKGIIEDACKRAKELSVPGFVAEVELLPPTTYNPAWGEQIIRTVREVMSEYEAKHGLKSALRATPVDIREDRKSPHMWHGSHWDLVMETFERSANAGADFLAIESIGGKDMHDDAIVYCEIDKSLFSLGILGTRDMSKLWNAIVGIAGRTGSIASGDTACGFANTAMVLADRAFVPKIFAAVVRVIAAVRSLVAIEDGAVGPHKDCGYEGVYVKAITGTPISMEGKSSSCAHLSPVGNVAACVADLWSNESVQNVKLLGGMAPTISMEQLAYDCRLMNTAAATGDANARLLRDWLADSDSALDPQAYVLRPEVVLEISKEFLKAPTPYLRSKAAALAAIGVLRKGLADGRLHIEEREAGWLDTMEETLRATPDDESAFIAKMIEADFEHKLDPKKYDL
jgi:methanol--5-hydroxybenzimidazolylcobamide Co-methyltransferase